jgi:hypothetical protein
MCGQGQRHQGHHGECGCQESRHGEHHEECEGGCHQEPGCECGCHEGRHACECGRHEDSGAEIRFERRFVTRAERIEQLEAYLKDLQSEAKGVEEHIAEMTKVTSVKTASA